MNSDELDRYLNGMAEEVMRRLVDKMDIDKSVSNTDKELIIHFYKYGMVGMMKAWVSEGMKADPEQLIRSIGRFAGRNGGSHPEQKPRKK